MATTLYSARWQGPEIVERGQAQTLSCPTWRDGLPAVPSSGTLSLYDETNTAVLDAVVVDLVDGEATYELLEADTASRMPVEGWRVEWALLMPDGRTHTFRRDAVLVYRRLYPVVTDRDLFDLHADLERRKPKGRTSYQEVIDAAWASIESKLVAKGVRPWLILSGSALREAHLAKALEIVFRDFSEGNTESQEWILAEKYEALFKVAWDGTTFVQATPTTGQAESGGRRRRPATGTFWLCSRGAS